MDKCKDLRVSNELINEYKVRNDTMATTHETNIYYTYRK